MKRGKSRGRDGEYGSRVDGVKCHSVTRLVLQVYPAGGAGIQGHIKRLSCLNMASNGMISKSKHKQLYLAPFTGYTTVRHALKFNYTLLERRLTYRADRQWQIKK